MAWERKWNYSIGVTKSGTLTGQTVWGQSAIALDKHQIHADFMDEHDQDISRRITELPNTRRAK